MSKKNIILSVVLGLLILGSATLVYLEETSGYLYNVLSGVNTQDFQKYTDKELKFSFLYPKDLVANEDYVQSGNMQVSTIRIQKQNSLSSSSILIVTFMKLTDNTNASKIKDAYSSATGKDVTLATQQGRISCKYVRTMDSGVKTEDDLYDTDASVYMYSCRVDEGHYFSFALTNPSNSDILMAPEVLKTVASSIKF